MNDDRSSRNIHYTVKEKRTGIVWLIIIAVVLLSGVSVVCAIIIGKSAILITDDGGVSLVIGDRGTEENPFDSHYSTTASTESSVTFSINDPPTITTAPVEVEGELTIPQIAEKVRPSVVTVIVSNSYESGIASGIILESSGYIITNNHVVDSMTSISVVLNSGEKYEARLIGSDSGSDIAVIKIEADDLTAAVFGNSDALAVGDLAVAIGTPYDISLQGTTTAGIISAISRDIVIDNRTMSLIQTDASINPGNSGGPLVNKYGQVIGITSLKIGEDFEGLGFAIPMNTAKEIIEELLAHGRVTGRPAIGISGKFLSENIAEANGLPVGLFILNIYTGSDAYKNGLALGDVITAIDGVKLTDLVVYNDIKDSHKVGDIVTLTVYRDTDIYDRSEGEWLEITARLMDEEELG